MKKYLKEIIILFLQLLLFYIPPIFVKEKNLMSLIAVIIFCTFVISFILGLLSKNKIKYVYPCVIFVLFLPAVDIYYDESFLIYDICFLLISAIAIVFGSLFNKLHSKDKGIV